LSGNDVGQTGFTFRFKQFFPPLFSETLFPEEVKESVLGAIRSQAKA
jgi:hypothetical protein